MLQPARIVFTPDLNAKWQNAEQELSIDHRAAVSRFSGTPEEILLHCRQLIPCVLVVDEGFVNQVRLEQFCDVVEFGRAIRVLVEVESHQPGRIEYLIRIGCAGVLDREATQDTALRALRAVLAGELWIDRKAIGNIVRNVLNDMKHGLTARENDILSLLTQGLKNDQIAERLFISPPTVRWHLRRLYRKLGTHDRLHAGDHTRWSMRRAQLSI